MADSLGGTLARKFGALRQTVERTLGISTGGNTPDIDFDDEDLTLRGQQKCSGLVKVGFEYLRASHTLLVLAPSKVLDGSGVEILATTIMI